MEPVAKKQLPQWLTTVTPFSKALAMFLFIILPFLGFFLGINYQQKLTVNPPVVSKVIPTVIPVPTLSTQTSMTSCNVDSDCVFADVDELTNCCPNCEQDTSLETTKAYNKVWLSQQKTDSCRGTVCPALCFREPNNDTFHAGCVRGTCQKVLTK